MTPIPLTHGALKARHRQVREEHPDSLSLRIHRALSWLGRSETVDDTDSRFIFLWIAFNAAYAQELDEQERSPDKVTFNTFLERLVELDQEKRIHDLIWNEFSSSIRTLLDNQYVFPAFWEFHRGRIAEEEWIRDFDVAKKKATKALTAGNTRLLLSLVFSRMYTLRNQLIHGGATWGGQVNREQLRDCARLLGKLVPLIISMMMDHPNEPWGDPMYPVIRE